jgi:hypothetical protein
MDFVLIMKKLFGLCVLRTALREGAKDGSNFAGHFTIVGWGCGGGCLDFGILDAENGHVYFPPEIQDISVMNVATAAGETTHDYDALRFKPDSNLLVVLGARRTPRQRVKLGTAAQSL